MTDQTLGQVATRLEAALQRAEIADFAVYGVGDDGFAIVTRLEAIDDNGKPLANARWKVPGFSGRDDDRRRFTLEGYLRALLLAEKGFYRAIVLVVTAFPVAPGKPGALPTNGATSLPYEWRSKPLSRGTSVTALVYEFRRRSAEEASEQYTGAMLARDHLVAAGLWTRQELMTTEATREH